MKGRFWPPHLPQHSVGAQASVKLPEIAQGGKSTITNPLAVTEDDIIITKSEGMMHKVCGICGTRNRFLPIHLPICQYAHINAT